ncbi:hypothetical protein [Actinoplanes sp. NPDC026619]|uniref:hypothetical protein n=1 Tax=Actinoplanes sp. NPDC026619 TaxID=3155798 RepID=UPI0033D94908
MSQTTRRLLAGATVRAAWGTLLVIAPRRVLTFAGTANPGSAVAVVRVLGARQLAQTAMTVLVANRTVAGCGALVDALHAGTGVILAAASPRWRRPAVADTLIAAAFAAIGWSSYRR